MKRCNFQALFLFHVTHVQSFLIVMTMLTARLLTFLSDCLYICIAFFGLSKKNCPFSLVAFWFNLYFVKQSQIYPKVPTRLLPLSCHQFFSFLEFTTVSENGECYEWACVHDLHFLFLIIFRWLFNFEFFVWLRFSFLCSNKLCHYFDLFVYKLPPLFHIQTQVRSSLIRQHFTLCVCCSFSITILFTCDYWQQSPGPIPVWKGRSKLIVNDLFVLSITLFFTRF